MMKIYQGVDIVEIKRLKISILKNRNFISDIFTENEIEYCQNHREPFSHYAGRFAAKEAGLKALGMGISANGIDKAFQEIETLPGPSGKPYISFNGWTEKICRKKGIGQFTVSISHTADYAIATVILTGTE